MSNYVKRSALALGLIVSVQPASGITFNQERDAPVHQAQGQLYYSGTVSRITNGSDQACMVSTGSNWGETGLARHAADMQPLLDQGETRAQAFDATPPIDLKGLSSNTPYLAFVVKRDQTTFMRFATGFNMNANTVNLTNLTQAGHALGIEIENRGDTGIVTDDPQAKAMLNAFMSGDVFTVSARSEKTGINALEHYIQYSFQGQEEDDALTLCLRDLQDPNEALVASSNVRLALTPADDADIHTRMTARAMACNRNLDPEETEVMRLSGGLTGFTSPLAYALAKRDDDGHIAEIWSGDLWRISRKGKGYVIAFSNSITRQSPLDAQDFKACTRFGAAQPIDLNFSDDGAVSAAPKFDVQLAQAGSAPQLINFANTATAPGQGASSGISLPSITVAETSVARVVSGAATGQAPNQTQQTTMEDPNLVPIPAGGVLLASFLVALGGWTGWSRRRKTA